MRMGYRGPRRGELSLAAVVVLVLVGVAIVAALVGEALLERSRATSGTEAVGRGEL